MAFVSLGGRVTRLRKARLLLLATCGLCWLTPCAASAQNPAAAEALFDQARAAMAAGSYDLACARFRDSDKLDPAVGTRFNLADCEEKRGKVATAWSLFRGVLSELAQDDDRRPIAQERVKALEPRLPYLTFKRTPETPPGARLRIDGVELSEGSFGVPLPMDPGSHDVALRLPDSEQAFTGTLSLREGEHKDLPIDSSLGAALPAAESAASASASASASRESFFEFAPKHKWAYVAGGVGALGVAFGTVTGIVALTKKDGDSYAALSAVGFGVGVIGLGTGAYLWFTAPKSAAAVQQHQTRRERANRRLSYASVGVHPELRLARGRGVLSVEGCF